ncbi:hypothetical protein [Leptotrichia wadei]|jgi:hypothetical protein|uniref:hypothetical protein n=1 Tax=Leptotrichia wadei TaxID=157687 RepID=UPI0028DBE6CE|nr:hypothetical protein [Leptotrichia wadei]
MELTLDNIKNEILNMVDESYGKNSELLDLVLKLYFYENGNDKMTFEEKVLLETDYKNIIREQGEKFQREADVDNSGIIKIVSAVSYSQKKDIFSELPFEKDLRIFKNIKKIYFLYTKETIESFNKISEEMKGRNIKSFGIQIVGNTIEESYKEIKKLIYSGKISKLDTIFDTTLGMKTLSTAMYRISSERQIRAINWNEKQISKYVVNDGGIKRANGNIHLYPTMTLNFMKEPIKEHLSIYTMINEAIEKMDYHNVAKFYKITGRDDMAFFYSEISKIFDLDRMLDEDSYSFYDKLERILKKIFNYERFYEKETQNKLKKVICFLLFLILYEDYEDFEKREIEWFRFNDKVFGIKEKDFKKFEEEYFEFDKDKYYYYLMAKGYFLSGKRNKIYLNEVVKKINDEIKADGMEEEFNNLDEITNYIYGDEDVIDFDFEKELKEETLKLTFGETFIKIPCLEAKNNFLEINVNLKANNIKYIPIYKLLEVANTERKLESNEVRNILENRDRKLRKEAKNPSPISRIFNEVKSVIKVINKLIKEEMKNNNLTGEDFILLNSQKANYSIFISEKFQW